MELKQVFPLSFFYYLRVIYSLMFNYIIFVLISVFSALEAFNLVIKLVELILPLIYLTFIISLFL